MVHYLAEAKMYQHAVLIYHGHHIGGCCRCDKIHKLGMNIEVKLLADALYQLKCNTCSAEALERIIAVRLKRIENCVYFGQLCRRLVMVADNKINANRLRIIYLVNCCYAAIDSNYK